MSKTYVIINSDEVDDIIFSEVTETSASTLRYNLAGTQTFVKYEGAKPSFLYGKDTYTHSQILEILATAAWSPGKPPDEN
mgnify:FL=1|jgi:hypothetical protein